VATLVGVGVGLAPLPAPLLAVAVGVGFAPVPPALVVGLGEAEPLEPLEPPPIGDGPTAAPPPHALRAAAANAAERKSVDLFIRFTIS
jgi:hypothetical protein